MANFNKLYKCVGENFKDGVPIGYCGDTKTLGEWIELCINEKKQAEIKNYTDEYVIDMIYISGGKHLEKVGKI